MKDIILEATERAPGTKGSVKELRRQGQVPGVAYGEKGKPMPLTVNEKSMQTILHSKGGRNALINLKVGTSSHAVLIKEIQRHPITRALEHLDFQRISLKEKIETRVPIHVKGEAPGVKLGGGVLETLVRDIPVRCLPTNIPESIDADISSLQLNQAIRAKELVLPEGIEILLEPESVILHVVTVHIVEETPAPGTPEAAAAAGAAVTEPEVIKKGKVEEGAEGAVAAPGDKKAAPAAGAAKPDAKKPEGK